ncbi:hypothetical protein GDO81_027121 [Engystomops pustulosus]|uniref:Uncharacterized protein n=1 Tax=Engystomops pustulosus TaxID=76066 RepID=A0AAV6YLE5_ENGPU|nr:hypothetical protein GDO81_027121 [Engystomops pustulosus]
MTQHKGHYPPPSCPLTQHREGKKQLCMMYDLMQIPKGYHEKKDTVVYLRRVAEWVRDLLCGKSRYSTQHEQIPFRDHTPANWWHQPENQL